MRATVNGGGPGQSARLYFRWKEHEDFYWVAMEADPGGRFWATPPKPEKRNEQVEYYAALVDPAGKAVARSETQIVKVTADCKPNLGPRERGVAVEVRGEEATSAYKSVLTVATETAGGRKVIAGTVFDGQPRVVQLRDLHIEFTPDGYILVLSYEDRPGMVGRIVVGRPAGPGAQPFDYFVGRPGTGAWGRVPPAAREVFPSVEAIVARGVVSRR